jgi:hypothetical protein
VSVTSDKLGALTMNGNSFADVMAASLGLEPTQKIQISLAQSRLGSGRTHKYAHKETGLGQLSVFRTILHRQKLDTKRTPISAAGRWRFRLLSALSQNHDNRGNHATGHFRIDFLIRRGLGYMNQEIFIQFPIGARVRIMRVKFPNSQKQFVGKTGTVQTHVTSVGSMIVLLDDGSTRVCLPENVELISPSRSK